MGPVDPLLAIGDGSRHTDTNFDVDVDADSLKSEVAARVIALDEFSEEVKREITTAEGETPLSLSHQVRHEVAIPNGYHYIPLSQHQRPSSPAREYKFKLDPFQQVSIDCLERGESVLVSAHTSAGKTVVAEYAIAMSLRDKQRVIYTSPIKALSNQKYRELQEEFQDVGLMTGDVTINPTASCLVMTTEILRSMLYKGSEVMREVAWVVFDEIHYMRDKERGVVWEETLILLQNSVHFVFLSATIPNARQFAEWICDVHSQPCHVVYTDYRPTPLQHYLFPAGGDGIHLAVDEKGTFREDNFQKALSILVDHDPNEAAVGRGMDGGADGPRKKQKSSGAGKRDQKGTHNLDLYKIVKMIMLRNYHPVIVFSFSKKDCESHALNLSRLDFNSDQEKGLVEQVFFNAIDSLSEDDRTLPQIGNILPLLKRGIGIHHSGLLPILKEVIEILFQEGLLKVLFATETFSIGLNMPARTVVFTNVRKFDGKSFRWISGGEYVQMSGRAGRRGLDERGIVILMLDEKMEPSIAKGMLKGQSDPLNSAFHLTYNMILNLMRVEGLAPERMLEKSFFQFQNNASLPHLNHKLAKLQIERENFPLIQQEEIIEEYYILAKQLESCTADIKKIIHHPSYILPFIQPGRLVKIVEDERNDEAGGISKDFGWGCFVALQKRSKTNKDGQEIKNIEYIVDTLLYAVKDRHGVIRTVQESSSIGGDSVGELMIVPVALNAIEAVSSIRMHTPRDLTSSDNRQNLFKNIQEIKKRFSSSVDGSSSKFKTLDGIPLLDPIVDIGVKDESFQKLLRKCSLLEEKLRKNMLYQSPLLPALLSKYKERVELEEQIKSIKKKIKDTTAVIHMEELKCRKRVLRRLQYTDQSDVIEIKGRVACEISTGDELLLTEMIFNGAFNDLSVEQTAALLSCFVFQEKADENVRLKDELQAPLGLMHEAAKRIAKVSLESKLKIDEEAYVQSFRPELMDVVYVWCKGAKFSQICKMTSVFEGSIIRCMRRLEELLRQMCQAAKSIGNTELENKFAEGINKIKRDIVFANSLYL